MDAPRFIEMTYEDFKDLVSACLKGGLHTGYEGYGWTF